MARRYDSQTTTFSPEGACDSLFSPPPNHPRAHIVANHHEGGLTNYPTSHLPNTPGRLYQVEYAIAAIQNAAAAIGILTQEGIVVVTEKKISSKLLSPAKSSEKIYKIADHCFTAVAGLTSDANILVNHARLAAARYEYTYSEAMPVEGLVQQLSDYVHGYTQSGGLRPFGVAFLYAGWDRHYGYQLYQSDPSGNYSGWKATAIGSNSQSATTNLKADFKEDMSLADAVTLALKTLTKAMDTTAPTSEKLEVAVLTRDKASGKITQRSYSAQETDEVLKAIAAAAPPAAAVPAP